MKIFFAIVALFFCLLNSSFAQNRNILPTKIFEPINTFFANIITLPTVSVDSLHIIFCYSVVYDNLVFQKASDDTFFAVPEIEATFRDDNGITRKRFISNDTVWANTFQQTQTKNKYYNNYTEFTLAKANYKIVTKLNNSKSIHNFPIETNINNNAFCLAPVILQKNDFEKNTFSPFLLSNSVSFAVPSFSAYIPVFSTQKNDKWSFEIQKKADNTFLDWGNFIDITGDCNVVSGISFKPNIRNQAIQLQEISSNAENNFLTFDILMDTFTPGQYTLTITNKANPDVNSSLKFDFEIHWFNMPISISDPEFAAEQMYIILTDEEFKAIKKGNKKNIFTNILNYWSENDPTSLTQYNEAMSEFFHRVDYAEVNFKTLTQKEGTKSDRGKVFILNGIADKITTETKEKSNFEIWHYNKSKTKYVFEIVSVGNYKLINIINE